MQVGGFELLILRWSDTWVEVVVRDAKTLATLQLVHQHGTTLLQRLGYGGAQVHQVGPMRQDQVWRKVLWESAKLSKRYMYGETVATGRFKEERRKNYLEEQE